MKKCVQLVVLVLAAGLLCQSCIIPRTAGKAAVGVAKGTGKAVKHIGRGVKNAVD